MSQNTFDTTLSKISQALRELSKKAEKEEEDKEFMKDYCPRCMQEIYPEFRCFGHGGGGGGGGGSGGNAKEGSTAFARYPGLNKPLQAATGIAENPAFGAGSGVGAFDPDMIAELIDNGWLSVKFDSKALTLSITLECEPAELTAKQQIELKKYMTAILGEYEQFIKEQHVARDCEVTEQDQHILSIDIAFTEPALYEAFIHRLSSRLFPAPAFSPTPLSMKPEPGSKKRRRDDDMEVDEQPEPAEDRMGEALQTSRITPLPTKPGEWL